MEHLCLAVQPTRPPDNLNAIKARWSLPTGKGGREGRGISNLSHKSLNSCSYVDQLAQFRSWTSSKALPLMAAPDNSCGERRPEGAVLSQQSQWRELCFTALTEVL